MADASAAVLMIAMVNELGCTPLQLFATSEQNAPLLSGVAEGRLLASEPVNLSAARRNLHKLSYGLPGPQAGPDAAALESTAQR